MTNNLMIFFFCGIHLEKNDILVCLRPVRHSICWRIGQRDEETLREHRCRWSSSCLSGKIDTNESETAAATALNVKSFKCLHHSYFIIMWRSMKIPTTVANNAKCSHPLIRCEIVLCPYRKHRTTRALSPTKIGSLQIFGWRVTREQYQTSTAENNSIYHY